MNRLTGLLKSVLAGPGKTGDYCCRTRSPLYQRSLSGALRLMEPMKTNGRKQNYKLDILVEFVSV